MLQSAREQIEKYAEGKRVTAAVSGGEDSMALLSLLATYRDAGRIQLSVIHIDHRIRTNSAEDAAFVAAFCRERGIPCRIETVYIPARCAKSGRGIESEAHHARREIFERVLEDDETDMIATAHHARDNVETVLLHLFRGCGLRGLSGMQVWRDDGIFRPFLTTEKEEIASFVRAEQIPFVTDVTNADTAYDRNYIRHEILPRMRERFPGAEKAILRTATFAGQADNELRAGLNKEAIFACGEAVSLKEEFLSPPYVFEALRWLGKNADIYFPAVDAVMRLKECKQCARVDVGEGIVAAREYGLITFYRARDPRGDKRGIAFCLPQGDSGTADTVCGTVCVQRVQPPYFPIAEGKLLIDGAKVPDRCVWRTRRHGDKFTPYGGGTRRLKEYLIDKKVPQRLRDDLLLLCCGSEVLAIVGMEISERLKADEQTVDAYYIYKKE